MLLLSGNAIYERIQNPGQFKIKEIKVLRAGGKLPRNDQVGGTCGIYALDAAFQIKGKIVAPPRKKEWRSGYWQSESIPTGPSIRRKAKEDGFSLIGEISGARDLMALAASLGVKVDTAEFNSPDSLWTLVRTAIDRGSSVAFPYASDDTGAPAISKGAAHWCLLFGYSVDAFGNRSIFSTTYGKYHVLRPFELFKGNQSLQDFESQTWVKFYFFESVDSEWRGQGEWMPEVEAEKIVSDYVEQAKKFGILYGVGKKSGVTDLLNKPRGGSVVSPKKILDFKTDAANFARIQYSVRAKGQCVVV
jgi:hypothetical protein